MSKTFVIKIGGSSVSTESKVFDFEYLKRIRQTIDPFVLNGDKFFFILGGGHTMRMYRDLAEEAGVSEVQQLHWIGTTVNVLHAVIAKAYFSDIADEKVLAFEDYENPKNFNIEKSVKFGGGAKPGHSGDMDAILVAKEIGAHRIISLKNIDGVYSADPKKDPSAVRVSNLTWDDYFEIIGFKKEHEPGGNYPIDPVSAIEAKESNLTFNIISSENMESLSNAIKGDEFDGSVVE